MKLRIDGNSVRIRLSRSEVARLAGGERIEQTTEFLAGAVLRSSIEPARDLPMTKATFENTCVAVFVPETDIIRWSRSDEVSITAAQPTATGVGLNLLIEKDFECLHGDVTENADCFPNPQNPRTRDVGTA